MYTTIYYGMVVSYADALRMCDSENIKSSFHFKKLMKKAFYPQGYKGKKCANITFKKIYLDDQVKFIIGSKVASISYKYCGLIIPSTRKARHYYHKFMNRFELFNYPQLIIVSK